MLSSPSMRIEVEKLFRQDFRTDMTSLGGGPLLLVITGGIREYREYLLRSARPSQLAPSA